MRAEKEALGVELKKAKEETAQLGEAFKELGKQAHRAFEEGKDLADQLLRYRKRKQESEEQLTKDR